MVGTTNTQGSVQGKFDALDPLLVLYPTVQQKLPVKGRGKCLHNKLMSACCVGTALTALLVDINKQLRDQGRL